MPRLECFRAASNCGLISASRCIGAAASDSAAGSTAFSEMKLTSITTTSGRCGSRLPSKRADVGFLHRDDPRMALQRWMQLAAADVDRKYQARAVGQQHFGKAAGGGADIEADMILDLDRISLQRACQLDAAARDEGMRRLRLQIGVGGNVFGRLQHRPAIGGDKTGLDRGLRPRAAFEQAAFDQQHIRALAGRGHDSTIPRGGALFAGPPHTFPAAVGCSARLVRGAPQELQASFTVSVLTSLPSASNTFATMLLASRRAWAYIAFGVS